MSEGECWWLVSNFTSFHLSATHTAFQAVAPRSRGNLGALQGIGEDKPAFRSDKFQSLLTTQRSMSNTEDIWICSLQRLKNPYTTYL